MDWADEMARDLISGVSELEYDAVAARLRKTAVPVAMFYWMRDESMLTLGGMNTLEEVEWRAQDGWKDGR